MSEKFKLFSVFPLFLCGLFATKFAFSQVPVIRFTVTTDKLVALPAQRVDAAEWLKRWQEASRLKAYNGTFVVSAGEVMSTSRIWHVADGDQQYERVDTLSGPLRTTLRRNDEVVTFLPEARIVVQERRESLSLFPALAQTGSQSVAEWYTLRQVAATERVAGFDTDAFDLQPKDDLRFGYRIWSEKKTGLILKMQTLDASQRVLEQVAFSELSFDTTIKAEQLARMMKNRSGYVVQNMSLVRASAQDLGWRQRKGVGGFAPVTCQIRSSGEPSPRSPMQWVFSDGLATVSVFAEPFDPMRHLSEGQMASGATHSLAKRLGDVWLTVVGEVPYRALHAFAQDIERIR